MSTYASFQGRVFLGKRDIDGLPIEVRLPGNVAELKLSLKTEVLEHYESQTGQRSLDHRMVKQKSATVNLTIEEFTKENLALALYGNHVTGSSGSVTAETIGGNTPVVGDRYFFAHPKVAAVVVTDSAGSPATLTAGTHYTVDTDFGALQFLDISGFTAPFKAAYTYGNSDSRAAVPGRRHLRRGHRDRHLHAVGARALPAAGRHQHRAGQRQGAGRAVPRGFRPAQRDLLHLGRVQQVRAGRLALGRHHQTL